MKIGGKAKAGIVNQNLEKFQNDAQQQMNKYDEESRKVVTEVLSKIKGLKVRDAQKEEKMPEVD